MRLSIAFAAKKISHPPREGPGVIVASSSCDRLLFRSKVRFPHWPRLCSCHRSETFTSNQKEERMTAVPAIGGRSMYTRESEARSKMSSNENGTFPGATTAAHLMTHVKG